MLLVLLSACDRGPWDGRPENEVAAWRALVETPIALGGRVVDADGEPLSGVTVGLHGQETSTDDGGRFSLSGVPRCNDLLTLEAAGFHAERVPVHLVHPVDQSLIEIGDLPLKAEDPDRVRMLFAGDVIFGRRFVDVDESTPFDEVPPHDAEALIDATDPYPGTRDTFTWVHPLLQGYDHVAVNLESVVTETPDTPHPTKPYVFFTFPESVDALAEVADYANLGNNHVYDYLEPGVQDTLDWVASTGMGYAGLGADSAEAFLPHEFELGSQRFATLSMTSVTGSQYAIGFVADDTRGGAADLTDDDAVLDAIDDAWTTGRVPIVQAHFGKEYAERPSSYTEGRLELLGQGGPGLIVGHHPHTPQGFGWHSGVLAAHSLGNFVFDQDRLETMLGLLFEVTFEDGLPVAARTRPIYLEDYRPRPLAGELGDWLLRKVGAVSVPYDASIVPTAGSGVIPFDGVASDQRSVSLDVEVGPRGWGVLDLRGVLQEGESVVFLRADGDLAGRVGRDQLMFGGFEDFDVDEDLLEVSRWDLGGDSQYVCVADPWRGAAAACSQRDKWNSEDSRIWFRNRVRVVGDALAEPNKDMSLVGYRRGENAGRSFFEVEYQASEGELSFGSDEVAVQGGGDFDWTLFFEDLAIPVDEADPEDPENNARAVRLVFHQSPPDKGRALVAIDDLALVNWFEPQDLALGIALDAPNAEEFLRVEGAPGTHVVDVTVATLR